MHTATPILNCSTLIEVSGPMAELNNDGIARAMRAMSSWLAFCPATTRLKLCLPFLRPPSSKLAPSTSSRLPRIDPVMEAFTKSSSPSRMATIVMISSAALPSVALSRPPMRGPVRSASISVLSPMRPASGMRATQARPNTAMGAHSSHPPMIASGAPMSKT